MAKNQTILIKDTVYKLQLALLDGIHNENQLFAAGSLMSRSDYEDVVTERSIANLCGYPLCQSNLPSDNTRKGRYRISLKEHKVYDLEETYKYCSSTCLINSRAFSGRLQDERCSVMNPGKLKEILRLFENLSLDSKENTRNSCDLGLEIQEKIESSIGEVPIEEWMGPSNAIEGYVPHRNHNIMTLPSKDGKELKDGSKAKIKQLGVEKDFFSDFSFASTVITDEEYSVSKISSGLKEMTFDTKSKAQTGEFCGKQSNEQFTILETPHGPAPTKNSVGRKARGTKERTNVSATAESNNNLSDSPSTSNHCNTNCNITTEEPKGGSNELNETQIKSSLKQPGKKNLRRSVTWADAKTDETSIINLPEDREMGKTKECSRMTSNLVNADNGNEDMLRVESAEACAMALSQAAEAITSGQNEVSDAVSEAGIIILPRPSDANEEVSTNGKNISEPYSSSEKSNKPGILHSDLFDPEDSWYDSPPEGFSLTLSSFATMWMAIFAWMTSSSLAYIYGKDEKFHEEFQYIDGREYPRKIVSADGRSSEIKQTLAGCLTRSIPGLASELKLSTPISSLEHGMGCLLDTMTFLDALPAFRMKQWQVIVLLFIEALSVCRIPSLDSQVSNSRSLFHKVLDRAQIRSNEYETLKDHILPLGRTAQFSGENDA
ncbi:putative RNA polymerase II subunit B1 CTD phosphatase RPAP2 homolog isoform X1 [Cucurbita maxima]|uniref:RNA polymerase II subunit B1 CTD phosphatase RPAP2 homolog n=1 Tax=Cucurbita maxima TaxID=3661 RepID=A0A6J1IY57_CUCMA|nr:putative RNA polymerase II subunit B1 CTD phosphatase RPAP2 homolog isoform X1 [Cucurbita maxima]